MQIITSGRNDVEEYFKRVVLAYGKLTKTPLLAFIISEDTVKIEVITNPGLTLDLPDDTKMMGQWEGEWRSDFFKFSAGELKTFVREHPDAVSYKKVWRMS